jgi:hypothetical protein
MAAARSWKPSPQLIFPFKWPSATLL